MSSAPDRSFDDTKPRGSAPSTRPGFSLGRWLGVQVRIDWSLLIVFWLIVWNLGYAVFPRWHPEWSTGLSRTLAVCAALVFFLSVLLHELTHAIVARAQGIGVRRITLFLFGGLAQLEGEPPSARAELLMAAVGPFTSLAIGLFSTWLGARLAGGAANLDGQSFTDLLHFAGPGATLLLWLGPINIGLAIFNMIPGFPLDGGRVLRAVLWWATGDLTRATHWASLAGRAFAWVLMALGTVDVIGGAFVQGLWLILIGWFLNSAAIMSYQRLLTTQALANVTVARVMRRDVDKLAPELTVEDFVREHLIASDQHGFPVESGETLLGLITPEDVRKLPHAQWQGTSVAEAMTPVDRLTTLPPDAAAERALSELAKREVDQIPVVDHGHLLGMVLRRDLLKWIALHDAEPARG